MPKESFEVVKSPGTVILNIDRKFSVGFSASGTTRIDVDRPDPPDPDRPSVVVPYCLSTFMTTVDLSLREFIELYKNMKKTLDAIVDARLEHAMRIMMEVTPDAKESKREDHPG